MLQQVLTIGGTIFHLTDDTDEFRMQSVDTQVDRGTLAGFNDFFFHLLAHLGNYFFDTGGVNTAVCYQLVQCQTGNFTANRVESREYDSFRSIIYNDFHTGGSFKGTDVTTFTADNTSFDFV